MNRKDPFSGTWLRGLLLTFLFLTGAAAQAQQSTVTFSEDFQSYGKSKKPAGWIDTKVGSLNAKPRGYFKTRIDPTQDKKGTNIVYGSLKSTGHHDDVNDPNDDDADTNTNKPKRDGYFAIYQPKVFSASGRFEVTGRLIRVGAKSRAGLTVLSGYPEVDKYYLINEEVAKNATVPTLRLSSFGAGSPTGTIDSNVSLTPGQWYRFRIATDSVGSATHIRARFWLDGTAEPATYSINATDASPTRLTAGRFGMWTGGGEPDDDNYDKGDDESSPPQKGAYIDDLNAKSPADTGLPTIQFFENGVQLNPGTRYDFNRNAAVEIRVADDLSSVTYTATLDNAPYRSLDPIPAEGPHVLKVTATDAVGNVAVSEVSLLIDKTAPAIALLESGQPLVDNARFKRTAAVEIRVTDALSAVTHTAKLDGNPYTSLAPIAAEGSHVLLIEAADAVGNRSTKQVHLVIDLTAPTIAFYEKGVAVTSANAKFAFNPNIEIRVADTQLGTTLTATLDGAPYESLAPITIDGRHTIVATAVDEAGNSASATLELLVDKVAPVVVLLESANVLDPATTAIFKRDAAIEIRVTDATSQVQSTVKLDSADYTSLTPITAEGTHTLVVHATDEAGNVTDVTLAVLIDKTAPVLSFFEGTTKLDPRADNFFARNVAIEITATDAHGTPTITATLDGAPYQSLAPISAEGPHVIAAHAVDSAGNFVDAELRFVVDKTDPVIALSEGGTALLSDSQKSLARDARVVISVTDNQPGVTYTAKLNGSDYTSDSVIAAEGTHTLTVHAVDPSGNDADATATLLIDKSGPTIAFLDNNVELSQTEPKHKFKVRPSIEIRVADALSTVTHSAKLNGTDYTSLTPINEGIHTLTVHAVDALGNATDATLALLVDLTAPVVVLEEGTNLLPATGGIFNHDLSITAEVADLSETVVTATLDDVAFALSTPVAEEGPHTLRVTAVDELLWSTTVISAFTVDKTAPIVTVREGTSPLLEGQSFARDVTLNATAVDITTVQFAATLDGAPYTLGTLVTADGSHTIVVTGTDAAGNRSEPQTIKFHIERANPEVHLRESGQPFVDGTSFPRDVNFTIEVISSTSTTNVAKIDGNPYTLGTPYGVEGPHRLSIVVTSAGGRSTTVEADFEIDKTKPTIRLMANGAPMTEDQTFSADLTPVAEADDNLTRPPVVVITMDGQTLAPNTVVSEEKVHTISAIATDRAGNSQTAGPFTFVLDKTDPVVTVKVDDKPLVTGDKFKAPITPVIKAEDLTPTTITATLDGQTYTLETPISEDGSHTLTVKATDRLGHETPLAPITFIIDKTAPVVTVIESDAPFVSGSKYKRPVTPTVRVIDTTETIVTATLDGNAYTPGQEISSEGHHELSVLVTDELGWTTPVPTISFTIDGTEPVVEVREGANLLVTGTIFNRDVQPKIVVTDATSTVTEATLDGAPFQSDTLITTEGTHTLAGKVTDELGLFTTILPITFTIDKTAPVVVLTESGSPFTDNTLLNHDAVPQATITDITAVTVTVTLDGAPYVLGTPVTIEGAHVITGSARDAAGWSTQIAPVHFVIDKTAPVVTITDGGAPLVSGVELGRSVTPVINITDISTTTTAATLNGAPFTSGAVVAAEGVHTLAVTVTDAAGWQTVVPPITFTIDKTAPVVRVLESGQDLVSGTKFNRGVLPQIVVTDSTATTIVAKLFANNVEAPYTPDTLIDTEGTLVLSVTVTDRGGNVTTVPPITFVIDRTPPVVTITESGQPLTSGSAFKRNVKPEIAIQDITQTTVVAQLNDQPFTFGTELTEQRRYALSVTVTDELGWVTTVPTIGFAIDNTPPVVQLVEDGKPLTTGSIFNHAIEPRLIIDDVTDTTVTATLNGAPYTMGTKIEAEGAYTLTARVVDAVGLATDVPAVTFRIDTTKPVLSFLTPTSNQSLTSPRVLVTGNADDSVSVEVSGVAAELDLVAKRFTVPALELLEGPNTIVAVGTDAAGNVSDPVSVDVSVDTRAPELTIAVPAANACLTTLQVAVSGAISDPNVASVKVAIVPGTAPPVDATLSADRRSWSATLQFPAEGKFVIAVTARDNGGHESMATVQVRIDQTKPRIEITESGSPFNASFVNRTVAPFVRVVDADPNVSLTVTLDGAPYVSGTPIASEKNFAPYELKATSTDCAGNKSDDVIVTFIIDKTPPQFLSTSPANGASIGTSPVVGGTVSPDTASVFVEGGSAATLTNGTFTFGTLSIAEGVNRFTLVAVDRAGNATRLDYSFTLKTSAPTVEIVENGSPIVSGTRYAREVQVDIRSNEADATITATRNGQPFTSGTIVSENGSHTISATARDPFGHTSPANEVTFTIDRDRPIVTFTEPQDGATVSTDRVRVRGTITGDPVSATINGATLPLAGGAFDVEIALEIGVNPITVIALDAAGNAGSASVDVTRGGGTLGLILNSPVNGATTNRRTTTVAGQVLSPAGVDHVTVNGISIPIDAAGAFRKTDFALSEGLNNITATVRKNGSEGSVSVSVLADFTPPAITVLESGNALQDESRFATRADITVTATDGGQSIAPVLLIDAAPAVSPVAVTTNGGHSLIATARDAAGNETRVERTFFIGGSGGGGCTLTDFDPANGSLVTSSSVTLVGRTGGAAGVKVNGSAAIVSNGSFFANVNLPAEGANTVTITCTDAAGTAIGTPATITLTRVTGAPSIDITTPADNSVTADEIITVSGTITGEVSQVIVNGSAATISGNTFSAPAVRLASGVNVIVARAHNAAGRTSTDSIRVTWLKNLPAITITSPAAAFTARTGTIDVSGVWTNLDPASLTVTNGGTAAQVQTTVTSDTTGTFKAASIALNPGLQTITVRGLDRLGRSVTATIAITRTDGKPSISITEPADNAYFNSTAGATFTVNGAFDAEAGATVEVNGQTATIAGSSFTVAVPFSTLAATPVVARVTEPSGTSSLDTIRVTKLGAAPTVVQTFPEADAANVDAGTLPLVLFSAPMDRASVRTAFRLENAAGTAVSGDVTLDRDVLTFAPAVLLTAGERYTIRIAASAADLAGNPLGNEFTRHFTVAATAPATAPTLAAVAARACESIDLNGTATNGARVRIELGTLSFNVTAGTNGAFTFRLPLSGRSGFQVARVRIVGTDGSLSPAAEAHFEVDCAGPQVTNATYDRATNALTVTFSKPIDIATVTTGASGSARIQLTDGTIVGGTVASLAATSSVSITPAQNLTALSFTLTITTAVKDTSGAALTSPYTRAFAFGEPTLGDGAGYISGEIFDADTGRPLPGASVSIDVPAGAFIRGVKSEDISTTATVSGIADNRGRYLRELPEGAHTIHATADGYTSVLRQIIVRTGAGVIPTDIRLTPHGNTKNGNGGALVLTHGGAPDSPLALPAELRIPAAMVATGNSVTLTSVGAQSLAGLLPLGWSPLASAEIVSNAASLSGSELLFTVPATQINAASQTLTAVRYFDDRDEWRVVSAVVTITGDKAAVPVAAAGSYALVYRDKDPRLARPADPIGGSVLAGVTDPCLADPNPCAPLAAKQALQLEPPVVLPTQRTVATLRIEGAGTSLFPSGTAVQAYVDEELRLADGTRDVVAPFATDLLLYRNLGGDTGEATFHLAPSARASEVVLEVGYDHIRILPYPERLDRGALIGPEGGRVPGDDRVAVEIPAGATTEALQATATSITDFASYGTIAGYRIVGGLSLSLAWAAEGDESSPVELTKPARATFTVTGQSLPSQLILVEALEGTPYGRIFRLAAQITALEGGTRFSTKTIDRAVLPVDGIVREGRYLLLAPDAPIAFATGTVHLGLNGPATAGARVLTPSLGVVDLTRITGIFNVPVPAAIFSLVPRTVATGDGAAYNHPTAPAVDAVVHVGALSIVSQPPTVAMTVFAHRESGLTEVTAEGATGVTTNTSVKASFAPGLDPQSVRIDSIAVIDDSTATVVPGRAVAQGSTAILWTLEPGTRLKVDTTYTAVVSPHVRGTNGTPLGSTRAASFSTISTLTSPNVDPSKIRITMPDADGRSQIIGAPGALTEGWNAVAVRRFKDFSNRPQDTANSQRAFLIELGTGNDPNNRVTIADVIYLQIINTAGSVAAIVQLGPFTTADGRGFVARADVETRYTTPDNVTVAVPAGAFEVPTVVSLHPAEKAAIAGVPGFDEELKFLAGFKIDFEGTAKKRLDITFPTPADLSANETPFLGYYGMSSQGPRIMMIDLLRRDGGNLTTYHPPDSGARTVGTLSARGVSGEAIVNPTILRDMMLGIDRASIIIGFTFQTSVNFITFAPPPTPLEFFIPPIKSIYFASFAVERNRILVPIPAMLPFRIIGVDPGSGLTIVDAPFEARQPGEPGDAGEVMLPSTNDYGPYPVFTSPGRTETLQVNADSFEDESIRGLVVKFETPAPTLSTPNPPSTMTVKSSASPLASRTHVEILNLRTGFVFRNDDFASVGAAGVTIPGVKVGDRLIFLIGEKDIDPSASAVTVAFSEPIVIGSQDELRKQFKLLVADPAVLPLLFKPVTGLSEIKSDSGGRRISIAHPGSFQRGKVYRLVLSKEIKDRDTTTPLRLGQKIGGTPPGDLYLDFTVRAPKGLLGTFDITTGGVRDLAMSGNVLLVSALEGGIFAYDASNPAKLKTTVVPPAAPTQPQPIARIQPPVGTGSATWALATDDHGRVFATAVSPMYGVVRSYRIEDFYCTPGGSTPCPRAPQQKGNAIIAWRTGINAGVPLASMMIGGWPEATPRKMQVVTKDSDPELSTFEPDPPPATPGGPIPGAIGNGFRSISIEVTPTLGLQYDKQRVTVTNETRNYRWSKDIETSGSTSFEIIGKAGDRIRVVKNITTLGVVSLFGHGVGVYDLNAVEANYRNLSTPDWERMNDTLALDTGDGGSCGLNSSCNKVTEALAGRSCPIADLALSPDAALAEVGNAFGIFALDQNRGIAQLTVDRQAIVPSDPDAPNVSCNRAGSLVLAERVMGDGINGRPWTGHPRLNTVRRLFREAAGYEPFARYTSIATFRHKNGSTYAIVAGYEYGLLVAKIGAKLSRDSLVDVIWIPSGAFSVRVMQDDQLAVVVDGKGRVILVNLALLDESALVPATPPPACSGLDCEWPLYPSARGALTPIPPPPGSPPGTPPTPVPASADGVGFDDPRIVWKSAPGMVTGTLAPIVDSETGFVYTGDVLGQEMNVVSAVDPKVRFIGSMGGAEAWREVDRIIPLGVNAPPATGTVGPGAPGSQAAFQIQVSLPGGVTEGMSTSALHMALESERVIGGATGQSPSSLPRAHLRQTSRGGVIDKRAVYFALRHDVPTSASALETLRFQRGWNRLISKWIVAIADPRAASEYDWDGATEQQKIDRGCFSCERPSYVTGTVNTDWYELYTAGRVISLRPERCANGALTGCASTGSIFSGTGYDYLGEAGRLEARVATVMADTVRPTQVLTAAQGAPISAGAHQETFLVHSGEVVSGTVDLNAGGRAGFNVVFDRTYRSRTLGMTPLGMNWDSSVFQRLRALPDLSAVEYRDGSGETWHFRPSSGGNYTSPAGFDLRLARHRDGWRLTDAKQRIAEFDLHGRIVMQTDEFYDEKTPGKGNVISYSYDAEGRLSRIVDPVGRTTTLKYEDDRLTSVKDWRDRELLFHYEPLTALLTQVEWPLTKGLLGYTYDSPSGRPKQNYKYRDAGTSYYDKLELATNLEFIKEPGDTKERVSFEYETSGAKRDMVKTETWHTDDNAKSEFTYTLATGAGALPIATEAIVTDALLQKRTYTLSASAPKNYYEDRVHTEKLVEASVPTWSVAAFGELPIAVNTANYTNAEPDRTWKFDYTAGRLEAAKLMMPGSASSALVDTAYTWGSVGTLSGAVLKSRNVTAPGASGVAGLAQSYDYNNAFLTKVTSGGQEVDAPEAHRGALTLAAADGGVERKSKFNDFGLLENVTSAQGGALEPGQAAVSGAGASTTIDYYDANDSTKHRRGMPSRIKEGAAFDIETSVTYNTVDPFSVTYDRIGRSYSTKKEYDQAGHLIRVTVTGTDVDTEDIYAYDARGRLILHRTKKDALSHVENSYRYDLVGRLIEHITREGSSTLQKTSTDYDLPNRRTTTTLPANGAITTTLDGLGRVQDRETDPKNPAFMGVLSTITERFRYDIAGNLVFQADANNASATSYDAAHRPVRTLHSDGTGTKTTLDGFGRLTNFEDTTTGYKVENKFTKAGKLISTKTNTSEHQFGWDAAGRTRTAIGKPGAGALDMMSEVEYDDAGRLLHSKFGESAAGSLGRLYDNTSWHYTFGDQPASITARENNNANSYTLGLAQDAFGRATKVTTPGAADMTIAQKYDAIGNLTELTTTPSMRGKTNFSYDGRGLMTEEKLPGAAAGAPQDVNQYKYDNSGVLTQYTDADGEPTKTENDGLGRTFRRTYPDNSTEEIHYDQWRVSKTKDRQDRWQRFVYDGQGRLDQVINNAGVVLDDLTYDPQGRVIRWQTPDGVLEFLSFDAENRPQVTIQRRFKKDGTFLDEYQQSHLYDGFGRRKSWSMPGASALTQGWATSVAPHYDAAGNLDRLERNISGGLTAGLLTSDYRASGRPNHRTIIANASSASPIEIRRVYDYESAAGRLNAFRVFSDGVLTAGSEVTFEGTQLKTAKLLGVANGERITSWEYDERGRLRGSAAASTDPNAASVSAPETVTPKLNKSDFLEEIAMSPGLAPTRVFGETVDGHKIQHAANASDPFLYKKADNTDGGGLRTQDDHFVYEFDEKQRLKKATQRQFGGESFILRVLYSYSGAGRMIGRRVEIANVSSGAVPADSDFRLARPDQLGPDAGLPASTTFVWDPISDQIVAVFEAERVGAAGAEEVVGRPIRQYIHGGLGLDDPIEVAVAEANGVARYYPIYDEAGDGNLQAILTETGKIVVRTILNNPYGDGEFALSGPAVEKVTVQRAPAGSTDIHVDVEFTEPIDATTLNGGVRLTSLNTGGGTAATSTATPGLVNDNRTVRWTLDPTRWSELTTALDAKSLSIAVTNTLRSSTYTEGAVVLPANTTLRSGVTATAEVPFAIEESFTEINPDLAGSGTSNLYELTTLVGMDLSSSGGGGSARSIGTLAGIGTNAAQADSGALLLLTASFQAQSFMDPLTLKNYVRARWYDPTTGSFLTPDPMGYQDSANLYAFAGGDPVNGRDPEGLARRTKNGGVNWLGDWGDDHNGGVGAVAIAKNAIGNTLSDLLMLDAWADANVVAWDSSRSGKERTVAAAKGIGVAAVNLVGGQILGTAGKVLLKVPGAKNVVAKVATSAVVKVLATDVKVLAQRASTAITKRVAARETATASRVTLSMGSETLDDAIRMVDQPLGGTSAAPVKTPTDLYAFGSKEAPRAPRLGKDVTPDADGLIRQVGDEVQGASTFGDPSKAPLSGHHHRLPGGTELPPGFNFVADGVDAGGKHTATHHTIFNMDPMSLQEITEKYLSLPWKYFGKK